MPSSLMIDDHIGMTLLHSGGMPSNGRDGVMKGVQG
jgi:hypothetical protein